MSDKKKSTEVFAALPARALNDHRFTAIHFRTLGVIGAHDRLDRNGRGCYASHKRLAALIGAHEKSLARAIAELIGWDYLNAENAGQDGRMRIYRLVYDERDRDAFRGDGRTHAPARRLAAVKESAIEPARSVTHCVTDSEPAEGDSGDVQSAPEAPGEAEIGNAVGSRSVTPQRKIGNIKCGNFDDKPLFSKGEGNRIYSTEVVVEEKKEIPSKRGLGERERDAGEPPGSLAARRAEAMATEIHRAVRHRPRTRIGPASEAEAVIDAAIGKTSKSAAAVFLELWGDGRSPPDARPSPQLRGLLARQGRRGAA